MRAIASLIGMCLSAAVAGGGCTTDDGSAARAPDDGRRTDGPLLTPPGYTAWFVVRKGEVFSDGFDMLVAEAEVEIDEVSVVGHDDGAPRFLGAKVALPGRPDDFNQRMPGFPPSAVPSQYQVDAEGAVLRPGETYMLILGFEVTSTQPHVREGIRLAYTAEGVEYVANFESRVVLCPRPMSEAQCAREYPADRS